MPSLGNLVRAAMPVLAAHERAKQLEQLDRERKEKERRDLERQNRLDEQARVLFELRREREQADLDRLHNPPEYDPSRDPEVQREIYRREHGLGEYREKPNEFNIRGYRISDPAEAARVDAMFDRPPRTPVPDPLTQQLRQESLEASRRERQLDEVRRLVQATRGNAAQAWLEAQRLDSPVRDAIRAGTVTKNDFRAAADEYAGTALSRTRTESLIDQTRARTEAQGGGLDISIGGDEVQTAPSRPVLTGNPAIDAAILLRHGLRGRAQTAGAPGPTAAPPAAGAAADIDAVIDQLIEQGLSDEQIKAELARRGYTSR